MDPYDLYFEERGELMQSTLSAAVNLAIHTKAVDPVLAMAISLLQQRGGHETIVTQLKASAAINATTVAAADTAPVAAVAKPADAALAKVHAHRRFVHGESPTTPGFVPARARPP